LGRVRGEDTLGWGEWIAFLLEGREKEGSPKGKLVESGIRGGKDEVEEGRALI